MNLLIAEMGRRPLTNICCAKEACGMTVQDLASRCQVFQLFVETEAAKL